MIIMKMIKNDKKRLREQETYLKKTKIKRENIGRIDTAICLKKRKKD